MPRMAKLIIDDQTIELPIIEGTEKEKAIDITQLRAKTGYITYDPGLGNTGSCQSAITFIDGEQGILRYRGIPVEELAKKPNFVEVAWLLIYGRLPQSDELDRWSRRLTENELLHESMKYHFEGFPVTAPPMAMLSAMINAMACFHPQFFKLEDDEAFEEMAARLISKIRTIAAFSHRRSVGLPFIYPDPKLRYCANLLHMMFSIPYEQYIIQPEIEAAMNLIFILHADHEQNCSTSTVRMVGSSNANAFASCAAGVCALWGPLHGGANVAVVKMLEKIRRGGLTAEECLKLAKDKNSRFRLMGFGHRIYKNYDPRAKILKEMSDKVFQICKINDPILNIARKLEELALKDPYFIDRKLYPNVDFYSGIILRAIGIPVNMFTVIFAIGRLPGWIAHWKEQHGDPNARICRPRQVYTGPPQSDYISITDRKELAGGLGTVAND
ncbi:MAG: citrate synthase [bacterium]